MAATTAGDAEIRLRELRDAMDSEGFGNGMTLLQAVQALLGIRDEHERLAK